MNHTSPFSLCYNYPDILSGALLFTHLHVHTEYSLLDGMCRISQLVSRAKELGMDSLAIIDHGAMYGVIEFYQTAREVGIKPIGGRKYPLPILSGRLLIW